MARGNHNEMQELAGAYAIDALESDETEAFELHVAECPRCRAEVRDHRETAALLAHAGTAAPDGLWDRIAGQLEEEPPNELASIFRMPIGAEREERRQQRFNGKRIRRMAAMAASVAAALTGLALVQQNVNQGNRIDDITHQNQLVALRLEANDALADPASHLVKLQSFDGTQSVSAVVRSSGVGYITNPSGTTALTSGRAYQLWGLSASGAAKSLGVLGGEISVAKFDAVGDFARFAITIEKAQGALQPTQNPLLSGVLVHQS